MGNIYVPYLESWIYYQLKQTKEESFSKDEIKEVIGRNFIREKQFGSYGNGLPKCFKNPMIDDLIHLKLIMQESSFKFKILNSNCDKKVKRVLASICY